MSANQTVLQTRDALNQLKSLTSDRGTARINVEAALRDLAAAAASLRGFASDVEHNPQLLLTDAGHEPRHIRAARLQGAGPCLRLPRDCVRFSAA